MLRSFVSTSVLIVLGAGPLRAELNGTARPLLQAAEAREEMASGLGPLEAAKNMTVPPGFHVSLIAGEPRVHQPIAFTFDERGRIWVAEAFTYPRRAPEGEGKDQVVIFEDSDGDGNFETRKVFAQNLNLVSGLEVGFGGVWVGAAPYLLFIPDRDGDDKPDGEPQVLLDGFGYQDTHETLNSFIWGPDGWLYGCHGVFTHSRVGKPGTPDEQRVPLNAGVWRYHPTRHQFDIFARGTSNSWGVDFNDQGQAFLTACVIPHLYHVIQGARYQRQGGRHFNPHVYDDIKTIADHRHYAGNIGDHAWWGQEPELPPSTAEAGGGHAHCGAMIYLGDNWPVEYRNQIFMHNIHGNRVNMDRLQRRGSGYVARHGPDMLLANDKWFRGISLKYGPDGAVYLIDWYDKNACHRTNPTIWDRTNGRIYKISYGQCNPVKLDLAKLADEELVRLQAHQNEWHVRTARRILQQRAAMGTLGPKTHDQLVELFERHRGSPTGLRALWALHVTGGLTADQLQRALQSDEEFLQAWAVQLSLEQGHATSTQVEQLNDLAARDVSPLVRLYLAAALQRIPLDDRWQLAERLLTDGSVADDHNLPLMIWYGLEPAAAADALRAMDLAWASHVPQLLTRFLTRRVASDNKNLDIVVGMLDRVATDSGRLLILEELLNAFGGRVDIPMPASWSQAYKVLINSDNVLLRNRAIQVAAAVGDQRVFPAMRSLLADSNENMERRREAMAILLKGRDPHAAPALLATLDEPRLRAQALRALAAYTDQAIPAAILERYGDLQPPEKKDAINTLSSRPQWSLALLSAIESGDVSRRDLHAYNVRQMRSFNQQELTDKITDVWGTIRATSGDKRAQITKYGRMLTPRRLASAKLSNGRRLFVTSCASCHQLFGEGDIVGPDITGSNRANLDYILENLFDPNAVVGKDYMMTVVQLDDGRVVQGLLQLETDSAITLRTINDTVLIAKRDIEDRMVSELSLMPEGLLANLQPDEVRDLVAYLASPVQVPLRGPGAPIDPATGRVPGAIEGESMKILVKSRGDARSQNMGSFSQDKWSGDDHLWWTGARPGDKLTLALPVAEEGWYQPELVLTRARDYGIVQLSLDGKDLAGPIDLHNYPDVVTTGVLTFDGRHLTKGQHELQIEIMGARPRATKAYMVGLDYVRLKRVE